MKPTKVQKLIYKMLTTSTGSQMCDSGDAYGRHRERNQKKTIKDFMDEKSVELELNTKRDPPYIYTISVFHYLSQLDLDETCDTFNRMKNKDWNGELNGYQLYGVSEKQANRLESIGAEYKYVVNTYNGESSLSQVLQYSVITIGRNSYALLQIHQGCDVRGGYTDAKMFLLNDDFMPSENIYGEVDGKQVSNTYDGVRLRYDNYDDEKYEQEIEIDEKTEGVLYLCGC